MNYYREDQSKSINISFQITLIGLPIKQNIIWNFKNDLNFHCFFFSSSTHKRLLRTDVAWVEPKFIQ